MYFHAKVEMIFKNILDVFRTGLGFLVSFFRLVRRRPDVIFFKGGYVCLPVGVAAHLLRIPFVVHDSDAVPGLTNRILGKWAVRVATGMPLEHYKNAVWTGIPVAASFRPVSARRQGELKKVWGFAAEQPLVVFTGGSLGAKRINEAVNEKIAEFLKIAGVILVAGRENYQEMLGLKKYEEWENGKLVSNFRMLEFTAAMDELLGAADVVVSRAGATTIAELAALSKAVVLVPNAKLPGRHQVKNAEILEKAGAVVIVDDEKMSEEAGLLFEAVRRLVRSRRAREEMAAKLHEFAKPGAARTLAEMVVESAAAR
jgi:UDP-N-acetylglucosamine--N-acetylmuramyl-(pentapeptide) pyrophosphoryl-undecaprenol N-acetylglucosamine transferase